MQGLPKDASFGLDELDEFGVVFADEVTDAVAEQPQRNFEFREIGHALLNGLDHSFPGRLESLGPRRSLPVTAPAHPRGTRVG